MGGQHGSYCLQRPICGLSQSSSSSVIFDTICHLFLLEAAGWFSNNLPHPASLLSLATSSPPADPYVLLFLHDFMPGSLFFSPPWPSWPLLELQLSTCTQETLSSLASSAHSSSKLLDLLCDSLRPFYCSNRERAVCVSSRFIPCPDLLLIFLFLFLSFHLYFGFHHVSYKSQFLDCFLCLCPTYQPWKQGPTCSSPKWSPSADIPIFTPPMWMPAPA